MRSATLVLALPIALWQCASSRAQSPPLTTLDYRVTGARLTVTPAALAVPKEIAGSVATAVTGPVAAGAYVEAWLRGPSFPARRLVGVPGEPLRLPPLSVVGDYSLDGIRLADGVTDATLLDGVPSTVPVQVFDEVLVSRVTSRPLSLDEIEEKGIVIDSSNFRAVEFEVGFVLDGETFPVRFPVVTPQFRQTTEIIPAAELEERLAEVERINNELAETVQLPPDLEVASPNIQIRGINVQLTGGFKENLGLSVPPIPALLVIPGNVGYLNQFFSVQIFTENAAPAASGLSVHDIKAELVLPAGPDRVPGTYEVPGDDPVRFARVGPAAEIRNVIPVRAAGPDGKPGSDDDIDRLRPGDGGQGEFLVEGLQEGLHVLDLKLTAKLDGLAAGTVEVEGRAAGSVQVSNPSFSLAFSHPRTIRAGEPYDAFVTLLNTSRTVANLPSISLNKLNLSGAQLLSDERVEFRTLAPGETVTARFRLRAQRTGSISFSNITTSDDSLVGRFRLTAGVDERGVSLSRNTLTLPDHVNSLPAEVVAAANRVLGQALSSSTAPQLPPGVIRVPRSLLSVGRTTTETGKIVTVGGGSMPLQLAEAGQRVRYGEPLSRVLPDLLLDWQGGREFSDGWDQIIRSTEAGREWREALMRAMENADPAPDDPVSRLTFRAADLAGRGEAWILAADSRGVYQDNGGTLTPDGSALNLLQGGGGRAGVDTSTLVKAAGYGGREGAWLVSGTAGTLEWKIGAARPGATKLSVLDVKADGTARGLEWTAADLPAGACALYDLTGAATDLGIDDNCDGTVDRTVAGVVTDFTEVAPRALVVRQDAELLVGRPEKACYNPTTENHDNVRVPIRNYGNILAVLFNKPMTQESAGLATAYTLDDGTETAFAQVQPGGRVALLTLRRPSGALAPRTLRIGPGVTDVRGNAFPGAEVAVDSRLVEGLSVRGRIVRADGSGGANLPVTLTMNDGMATTAGCVQVDVRVAQVFSDANGDFAFPFVVSGIPFSLSTTDVAGVRDNEAVALILESSRDGAVTAERLEALGASAQGGDESAAQALRRAFGVASFSEAVALAEGLDRAVVRDFPPDARQGGEGVYVLRFRGRGTVTGRVLEADGVTPIAGAAVNLFPDPDSRELGRGLFSDASGGFTFLGVPLGGLSVEVATSSGRSRTVSGLLADAGQTLDLPIVVGAAIVPRTTLQGRVTEPDGTAHDGATVFVSGERREGIDGPTLSQTTTNAEGYWIAENVLVGNVSVVAISRDGRRKGERPNIAAVEGAINTVNLTLQARATVRGRVEFSNGDPVAGAIVGGGEALVTTDALGGFVVQGVPTGPNQPISAGLAADPDAPDPRRRFARIGTTRINVLPGDESFAVVRFTPAGRIAGQVLDETGQPVPNVNVAIPVYIDEESGSFMWVPADANGLFAFDNLGLSSYDLSAPAPPVEDFDAGRAISQIRSGDQAQIEAAIKSAFAAFTGASDPFLNGEGDSFDPTRWGFVKDVRLRFDGETVITPVRFLPKASISGVVKNGQGVPIGAKVRLTGIGPKPNGEPTMRVKADLNSDPALGTFAFPNGTFIGDWGLQAASPFFPIVISASGRTTQIDPVVENVLLQFPPERETDGSLSGQVLNPDGTAAGPGIRVHVSVASDFFLRTGNDGTFRTSENGNFSINAGGYTVTALDEATGATGRASVTVSAAQDNQVTVVLLGRGTARVAVKKADGAAAVGAAVELVMGGFPGGRFEGATDPAGVLEIPNLFEGPYAACASLTLGGTRVAGRASLTIPRGGTGETTITLGGTGTVRGQFVGTDARTPIPFANANLSGLAVSPTDADGRFTLADVPLGTHRLTVTDPATGRSGVTTVSLTSPNQIVDALIVETALGRVFGLITNGAGTGVVPNAEVKLTLDDPFATNPRRSVTTGPDGAFAFEAVPAGTFSLEALDLVSGLSGSLRAALSGVGTQLELNLALQATANVTVRVLEPDGVTPANATVKLVTTSADTGADGSVRFENVRVLTAGANPYPVTAVSRSLGQSRSVASGVAGPRLRGAEETVTLILRGVGTVDGQVRQSDGTSPAAGAEVRLTMGQATETAIADGDGRFRFIDVPVGTSGISASSQALGVQENVVVAVPGETVTKTLVLSASGTVTGRVVRADGTAPAPDADVIIRFRSASNADGAFAVRTGADGRFLFAPVTLGPFSLESTLPTANGLARATGTIDANGQTRDLGDVVLDEAPPAVVSSSPSPGEEGTDINATLEILFSEPLDPATIAPSGLFLRKASGGAAIAAAVTLVAPPAQSARRLVLIDPVEPLESETTYQLIAVDGDLLSATGGVTNSGPRDLVGRALTVLYSATFTTRDQRPPVLLSFTPENAAEQVDPRTVVRLSVDEPIQDGATVTLTGPAGAVAGTTTLGLNGLVLTFVPSADLPPNTTFSTTVNGVRDLAGNAMANQPLTRTFSTLDTLGPVITELRLKNNPTPVAGAPVTLQALLATPEPGVTLRFSANAATLATSAPGLFELPVVLPSIGSVTYGAIAIDRFGNEGPLAELRLTVLENQPPVVSFAKLIPATGTTVLSGSAAQIRVTVADDGAVSTFRAAGTGAWSAPLQTNTTGAPIVLSAVVPAATVPGSVISVLASATDASGLSSGERRFDVPVADGSPPTLAFASPAANALVRPDSPLTVDLDTADNSGNVTLEVTLTGDATGAQSTTLTAPPNTTRRATLTFDLAGAPRTGGSMIATARATDATGHSTTVVRSFLLADIEPPALVAVDPADGSASASVGTTVTARFSDSLNPATVTAAAVSLTTAGTPVSGAITLADSNREIRFTPAETLVLNNTYSFSLTDAIRGQDGNPIAPVTTNFTVTIDFRITAPASDTRVIEGQTVAFTAGPNDVGFDRVVYTAAGRDLATGTAPTFAASVLIPTLAELGAPPHLFGGRALNDGPGGGSALGLSAITLDVRPAGGDEDGDGLLNGDEIVNGLDPFTDDAREDADSDGRSNAQELAAGTNPRDSDTDDDGLNDGQEAAAGSNPLLADSDGDGLRDGLEPGFGTSPVLADTDGDTLNDGFELGLGRISFINDTSRSWVAAQADAATRGGHLLTLASTAENAAFLALFGTDPRLPNAAIGHSDRFIEGAFRTVTGEVAAFTNFGPGEPNNVGNEDAVILRTDGRWNDASETAALPAYVLETGFFTNPLLSDTDGDGIADALDAFSGGANQPPAPIADSAVVDPGSSLVISVAQLLANDSDPDGDPLVLAAIGAPAHGSAVFENNGSQIRYSPAPGFSGADSFQCTVMDAFGSTADSSVAITVGVNSPPLAGGPLVYANRSITLDGTDDSANGPLLSSITDSFTMELWVKPARARSAGNEINSGASGQFIGQFAVFPTHGTIVLGGDPHAGAGVSVGTNGVTVVEHATDYFPTPLVFNTSLNDWTHVAVVYENKVPRLFINGLLVRTGLPSPRLIHPSTEMSTALGRYQGFIDEFRVWDFARSSEEIASDFARRLDGSEPGLAVYWRMDEAGGSTLLSDDPASRNGTLPVATNRLPQGAPLATRGQSFLVPIDTTTPLALPGTDPDSQVLTARVLSLPARGRLFQAAAAAGPSTEITSVPAVVTSPARVVFYQPDPGFAGDDWFAYTVNDGLSDSQPGLALLTVGEAPLPVANDLWDVGAGSAITASSGFRPDSSGANVVGATGGAEAGIGIFADGRPSGFTHFVEWESGPIVRLEAVNLFASNDPGTGQRGFTEARLFGRLDPGDAFTLLATYRPGVHPYFPGPSIATSLPITPFIGKHFRAEFDQFGTTGPRIAELDAVGESIVFTPINNGLPIALQNATSDRSQGGFSPALVIDGNLAAGSGWAGDVGGTPPMTAVFETTTNASVTVEDEFVFNLIQFFGGQHFIGNFRLSATTDDRSLFADGLINNGDITTNWTVLDVTSATSTGGETVTVLPDKSVLIGGTMPATTTYTVRAKGIAGAVTGFRLELLEHPSLPNNGPGRVGHGNWVLNEFTAATAALAPNRAPQGAADSAQTPQGFSVTTGNVLANDSDPENDLLSVFDFTQPASGTGTVVDNANGTFTYTPPNEEFTGTATFTYRPTDGFQVGRPTTVTVTVNPVNVVAWNNPAGGSWSTASNWSPARVPGANDRAEIALAGSYVVTLASGTQAPLGVTMGGAGVAATLRHTGGIFAPTKNSSVLAGSAYHLDGGTLAGTGTLRIEGAFEWTAGIMRDAGKTAIAAGATGTISGGNNKDLSVNRLLENSGSLTVSGNTVFFNRDSSGGGARIENLAGGTLEVQGETDFSHNFASPGSSLTNAGLFRKSGGGVTRFTNSTIAFHNSGTVEIVSGVLSLEGGGSNTGTLTSEAAGTLSFGGNTFTSAAEATVALLGGLTQAGGTSTFAGPVTATGPLTVDSGSIAFSGPLTNGDVLSVNGGSVAFNQNQTFAQYSQSGGTLGGTGTVTVTSTFAWTGGTMRDAGTTFIAAGATGTISGGNNKDLAVNRVLANAGTLAASGNTVFFNRDSLGGGARIENLAGATLEVQGETDFSHNFASPGSSLTNAGLFRKSGGGETRFTNSTIAFHNSGTVEIVSGVLSLEGGGSNTGALTSEAAGTLSFGGNTFTSAAEATVALIGGLTQAGGTSTFAGPVTATGPLTVDSGSITFIGPLTNGDVLSVNGGSVAFNQNQTFAQYSQSGGTLGGTGTMTVTGTFAWSGGSMRDAGTTFIAAGAAGTISGGNNKDLAVNRVLANAGTLTVSGGTVFFNRDSLGGGARIENLAGATLEVQGETDFSHNFASPGSALTNAGLFRKSGGGETRFTSSTIAFHNSGTVEIISGVLSLEGGGTLTGFIDVQAAGALDLAGGSFTTPASGSIVGAGSLRLSGGSATLDSALNPGSGLSITNGTWTFNTNQSVASYSQSGGTLRGTGTVTVTNTFAWTGGSMRDAGKTVVASEATGAISGVNNKDLSVNRVLENAGTLTVSGANVFFNRDNLGGGARIENLTDATLEVQGETDFSHNFASPGSSLTNAGLFRKSGGGETRLTSSTIAFHNSGTVEIISGVLSLEGGGTLAGSVDVQTAGTLELGGGSFTTSTGSTIAGAGAVRLAGGSGTLDGAIDPSSRVSITNGTWTLNTDQNFTSFSQSGGTLRGAATVTVTGTFAWTGGSMRDAGKTAIASGATGAISGVNNKDLSVNRVFENAGTLTVSGATVFFNRDNLGGGARIENLAGATLDVEGETDFSHNFASPGSSLTNAGLLRKSGGGTTRFSANAIALINTGTIEFVSGTLEPEAAFTQNGIVRGSGILAANVTNNGTFQPDPVPGGLIVQGTYTQTAAGRLDLRLAGSDPLLQHRSLRVSGVASLNGTLDIALEAPFAETVASTFPILSFASRTGDFTAVTGLAGNFGYDFSRAFTPSSLDLTVTTQGELPAVEAARLAAPPARFADWIKQHAETAGASRATKSADDPDGDGSSNLLEFAFGTGPFDPHSVSTPVPSVLHEAGRAWATLEFRRRTGSTPLTYQLFESTNLVDWAPVADTFELSREPVPGQPGLETVRLAIWPALVRHEPCFLSLHVREELP